MFTRRAVLATAAALPIAAYAAEGSDARFAALEKEKGGRIGVAAIDTNTGQRIAWRANERFLMCSTFKLLLVSATLKRIEQRLEQPHRHITYTQADLLGWAPVTKLHVAEGMDVIDLCAAAIDHSDNTAANLLYVPLGGPEALQRFAHTTLRDATTRIDRNEPALNYPDGDKDTTTPAAMLADMHTILLGNVLSPTSRKQITGWMISNTTGDKQIRLGLPAGWTVGDKSGNGSGAHNDLGIAIPPGRKPILISAYTFGCGTEEDEQGTTAAIARIVADVFA